MILPKPEVSPSWPMILVSWHGANAYSLWANGGDPRRYKDAAAGFLPSEAQWEYAARGVNPTSFPWGEAPASQSAGLAAVGTQGRADGVPAWVTAFSLSYSNTSDGAGFAPIREANGSTTFTANTDTKRSSGSTT